MSHRTIGPLQALPISVAPAPEHQSSDREPDRDRTGGQRSRKAPLLRARRAPAYDDRQGRASTNQERASSHDLWGLNGEETDLPLALLDHLFDRARERQITTEDLYELKLWRESEPEAPDGPGYTSPHSRSVAKGNTPK